VALTAVVSATGSTVMSSLVVVPMEATHAIHMAPFVTLALEVCVVVVMAVIVLAAILALTLEFRLLFRAYGAVDNPAKSRRYVDLAANVVLLATGRPSAILRAAGPTARADVEAPERLDGFWRELTAAERLDLAGVGAEARYEAGTVLLEQGNRADHVIVLWDGHVEVTVTDGSAQHTVAYRHAGDIVGEQAAIQEAQRSATVVALTPIVALVVSTTDFACFLGRHPHLLDLLRRQLYDRLTETHRGILAHAAPWTGQNCTIVFTDVVGFTGRDRNDHDRLMVHDVAYDLLRRAFEAADVPWPGSGTEDRGDGMLLIVPPDVPTNAVLGLLAREFADCLCDHNTASDRSAVRIHMRVAVGVGPVLSVTNGVLGSTINRTRRIVDARQFKERMAVTHADLGIAVSDYVYENIISPAPGPVGPAEYQPITADDNGTPIPAWAHFPAPTVKAVTADRLVWTSPDVSRE
jgi:CRP-like cAMP-binding protein